MPPVNEFEARGEQKHRLLEELGYAAASEQLVRDTAMAACARIPAWQPRERIRALARFVASLPYYREPLEDFPRAAEVLRRGGDCDDQAMLLVALAWAIKLPARVLPQHVDENGAAGHYVAVLGYPEAESPEGTASTRWLRCETILPDSRTQGVTPWPMTR